METVAQPTRWSRLLRWGTQGMWAVLDKGLFALSNFLLNVLLVRWLTPEDYGALAVTLTTFYLLGTLHTGLLSEPLLVFGPGRWKDRIREYLHVVLRMHWRFGAAVAGLFGAAALVAWGLGSEALAPALAGMALAAPFVLFQWLARVACFAELKPRYAAWAGGLYMALVLLSAWGLERTGVLGTATALLVMGGASLVSGLWLQRILDPVRPADAGADELEGEVRGEHWRYGRWAGSTGFLGWLPDEVYYLLLPLWFGLAAAGVLRALMNLVMPVVMTFSALGVLLTSLLVRTRGTPEFRRLVRASMVLFVLGAVAYYAVLWFYGDRLLAMVYGGDYARYAGLFRILGLMPVVGGPGTVLTAALRARERPDRVFWAYAASVAVTLTAGLALTWRAGLTGAAIGLVITSAVVTGLLAPLNARVRGEEAAP